MAQDDSPHDDEGESTDRSTVEDGTTDTGHPGEENSSSDETGLSLEQALDLLRQGKTDQIPGRLLDELRGVTDKLDDDTSTTGEPESDAETETDESGDEMRERLAALEQSVTELRDQLDSNSETRERIAALEQSVTELRDQLDSSSAGDTDAVAELRETVTAQGAAIDELQSALETHQSEFEKHRREAKRERERIRKYSLEEFAEEIIRVKDSLENILEFVDLNADAQRQVELADKQFGQALERSNVEQVDTTGTFDLSRHKVIDEEPSEEHDPDEIVRVRKHGYQLHDRVIRPAEVVIAVPDS